MTLMSMSNPIEVVTLGETMALFVPDRDGPLEDIQTFRQTIGGTESNTAIGLARLGHRVCWVSRVGDDPLGRAMTRRIRAEGVDTSCVTIDPVAATGLFVRERLPNGAPVGYYYRTGSAASRMRPTLLDGPVQAALASARLLHLTGISPILSDSMHATVESAISRAEQIGLPISFDPNLRLRICPLERARAVLLPIVQRITMLLAGLEEMRLLLQIESVEMIRECLAADYGVTHALLKDGGQGVWVAVDGQLTHLPAVQVGPLVDTTGAGDAFNAGYVAGWLRGMSPVQAARVGVIMGAHAVASMGDYEGLPGWPVVAAWLGAESA